MRVRVHLLNLEALSRLNLLLPLLFLLLPILVINLGLKGPVLHERSGGAVLAFLCLTLGVYLLVQHLPYLLVFIPSLHLFNDLIASSLLILLNALLNVLAFLSLLKFFIFVVNDVGHLVHHGLDAGTSLGDSCLTLTLFLVLKLNHPLNFFVLGVFAALFFYEAFLLLLLVIANNLHCSLSFLVFFNLSVLFLHLKIGNKLLCLLATLLNFASLILLLLRLGFLKHPVTHLFVLHHRQFSFLLFLFFDFLFMLGLF